MGQHTVTHSVPKLGVGTTLSSAKVLSTLVFALQHMWSAHQERRNVDHGYGSCAGPGHWVCLWYAAAGRAAWPGKSLLQYLLAAD